jgi:MoxR-like ATPase
MGGKARALMDGRPNVAAEDIWALAPMALRHRLVLGYDALADGVSADDIVSSVVEAHPEPVESPATVTERVQSAAATAGN